VASLNIIARRQRGQDDAVEGPLARGRGVRGQRVSTDLGRGRLRDGVEGVVELVAGVGTDVGAAGGRGVVEDGGGTERLHHGKVARGAGRSDVEAGALRDAVSGGYFDHAVTGAEALREEEGEKGPQSNQTYSFANWIA